MYESNLHLPASQVTCGCQAGRGAALGPVRRDANGGIMYSANVRNLADLRDDDKAAAEEAVAQNGRPGYCGDRNLRAAAGGQYCAKFDKLGK